MDLSSMILAEHLSDDFWQAFEEQNISLLCEPDKRFVNFFLEITRHLQELNQLFHVFRFNLLNMRDLFTLTFSDSLIRNDQLNFVPNKTEPFLEKKEHMIEINDKIAINALTINFISSGKTLSKSIETLIENDFCEEFSAPKGLDKAWLNKIYDNDFNYRFLVHLRDFAQHGHLPVSVTDNKFGFDLGQILGTPHFSHNSTRKKQFESIANQIIGRSDYPRLTFTYHIAGYNLTITKMYVDFLRKIKSTISASKKEIDSLISRYPDNVILTPDKSSGLFVFMLEEDDWHTISIDGDVLKMHNDFLRKAKKVLHEEQLLFDDVKLSILNSK